MRLIFDFLTEASRRVYNAPVQVITANCLAEVLPALRAVEAGVSEGFHAAGYVAYEAAPAFDPAFVVRDGNRLPLLCFGLFRSVEGADGMRPGAVADIGPWSMTTPRAEFDEAIDAIHSAIAEGRTYQVNYSTRFRAQLGNRSTAGIQTVYEQLRAAQGPGYHALLDLGRHQIISASPELFFQRTGNRITARPMKGTRARGRWYGEDRLRARELYTSEKDRAENLMIVDLLRNDIGRIARSGTVEATRLYSVERFRTVFQLTSTVAAELRDGTDITDLFTALFPCGSVTGAPKISTMQMIAGLEDSPREVYCGAIGYIEPGGGCTFSVPIRTMWVDVDTGECEYGSGAGITWDSKTSIEYEEIVSKAAVLVERWPAFEIFETMRIEDGRINRLERHLRRLSESAAYFGYAFQPARVDEALQRALLRVKPGLFRLRLFINEQGRARAEAEPFVPSMDAQNVTFATTPVDSSDRFLFHKTTNRRRYEEALASQPGVFDVLLWNERGEVTEFTRGNVVISLKGRRVTPPRSSGLLAGTFRQELLDAGAISEQILTLADVRAADRIWLINSVREWVPVALADVHAKADTLTA